MFGYCLPGLTDQGSDLHAGGRNHEDVDPLTTVLVRWPLQLFSII